MMAEAAQRTGPASSSENPRRASDASLVELAIRACALGDLRLAEDYATQALLRNADEPDALNILGILAAGRDDMERAAELLSKATHLRPESGSFHSNFALALKALGYWSKAIAEARIAIRLQPENLVNWNTLSASQCQIGDDAAAAEAARTAICLDPALAELWHDLGNASLGLGDYVQGSRAFLAALSRNARYSQAWSGLGMSAMRQRRYGASFEAFARSLAMRRSSRWWPDDRAHAGVQPQTLTNTVKLRHDIEQLDYIRRRGVLDASFDGMRGGLRTTLERFVARSGNGAMAHLDGEDLAAIGEIYGRIVVWNSPQTIKGGALADVWDRRAASERYEPAPRICWIDHLLKPEALSALRRFCLEATIWNDVSHDFQSGKIPRGYIGAYVADGFVAPLLFQIAEELTRALPAVFEDHELRNMWAYKYDETLEGIHIHGDEAAVNVNFWITPDDANLDPEGGGLVVFPLAAPKTWNFAAINQDTDEIIRFVNLAESKPVNIPYRQNRAVIFDSDLFHATAPLHFRPGYENRRINVTMLFGRRR